MSSFTKPFLKAFGIPVTYDGDRPILGIYDKQPVDTGGGDFIAETIKVDKDDVPELTAGKTFFFFDTEYKCKTFDPERSGFIVVVLEKQ